MLPESTLLRQKRIIRDASKLVLGDPVELGAREKSPDFARVVVEELTDSSLSRSVFHEKHLSRDSLHVSIRELNIHDEPILELCQVRGRCGQRGLAGGYQQKAAPELVIKDLGGIGHALGTVGVIRDVSLDFIKDNNSQREIAVLILKDPADG